MCTKGPCEHGDSQFKCSECHKSFRWCSSASRCAKNDRLKAELAQQSASQETTPRTTPRARAPRDIIRPPSLSAFQLSNAAYPSIPGPSTAPSTARPFAADSSANVYAGGVPHPASVDPLYAWPGMHPPARNLAPHHMNLRASNSAPEQPNPLVNNLAPDQPNPPVNNPAPDQTNNPADLNDHLYQFGHIPFNY
ncbi:hypothetical protein FRC05_003032 [Tulasnella sp. 425]|nr:hypothetical protein FRC05_003032 [Tulasnella sp. 425]